LALVCETFVFFDLGLVTSKSINPNFDFEWSMRLIGVTLALCFITRAINVFGMSAIMNKGATSDSIITKGMQTVLWFGGLRGAIAFALAVNFPGQYGTLIQTTTLAIVLITSVGQGVFVEKLVDVSGVKQENSNNAAHDAYRILTVQDVIDKEHSEEQDAHANLVKRLKTECRTVTDSDGKQSTTSNFGLWYLRMEHLHIKPFLQKADTLIHNDSEGKQYSLVTTENVSRNSDDEKSIRDGDELYNVTTTRSTKNTDSFPFRTDSFFLDNSVQY
jgi:hypothetical protein